MIRTAREISKETDLEDTDQTIDIENTPEGKNPSRPATGSSYAAIAAGIAACIAGIFPDFYASVRSNAYPR